MVSALTLSTIVLSSLAVVRANPVPSAPGPGDVFQSGKPCTIEWSADTTGQWKNMAIELMTGDNWSMVHLTTVTTIDATTQTSYSWTCPAVTPNAPIYFYQFSAVGQNLTWTTRWTIASENGDKVAAPNQTQPDGQNIPWGVGALVDQASATPPPPWLASSPSSSAGSSSAAAAGSSAPVSSASVTGSSAAAPSSSAASTPKGSSSSSSNPRPSGTGSSNSTVATSGNNSTNAASAALGRADVMPVVARGATALAAVAAVFAAAL